MELTVCLQITVRHGWTPIALPEIDFADSGFPTLVGSPHPLQAATFPVFVVRELDGMPEVRCIGTCFCISSVGLVATAYHVVEEAFELMGYSPDELASGGKHYELSDADWQIAVLYWSDVRPIEISAKQKHVGGMLGVRKIWPLAEADLALMYLDMKVYSRTKELIYMPMFTLSPGIPEPGMLCFGFGYHSSDWKLARRDGQWQIDVKHTLSASKGEITEVYFPRRDRGMLSYPSFATSLRINSQMSGGPICNEWGGVVGVISAGLKTNEPGFLEYGTMIGSALFIELDVAGDAGGSAKRFLYEYPCVTFDSTMRSLRIRKTARDVVIDFGGGRLHGLRRQLTT